MTRLTKWARAHRDLLIVLAVIVGLYSASTWQDARTRAAQQRQGQMIEQRLCASFRHLAELHPPAGNPATNPSRGFDQQLHVRLDELGTDIGCHGGTP